MIQSFADAETEKLSQGTVSRRLPQNIQKVMHRKLVMVNAAAKLEDLRVPPMDEDYQAVVRMSEILKLSLLPFCRFSKSQLY